MRTLRKSRQLARFARVLATAVKMTAVVGMTAPQTVNIAYASKYDLPKPYVSRALDAVLIPINHASRHRYQIPPKLRGVYVLAVSPHGVAARQGIRPGDVLATVRNKPISTPADVDSLIWAALALSATSFLFGVNRGTEVTDVVEVNTNITVNNFNTNISVNNITEWKSVENHADWTQIVDQYDDEMKTSLSDTSYRDDEPQPGDDRSDADMTPPDVDNEDSSANTTDNTDDGDASDNEDDGDKANDSADDDNSDGQADSSDQNDNGDDGSDDQSGSDDQDDNDGNTADNDDDDDTADDSADDDNSEGQPDSSDQNDDGDDSSDDQSDAGDQDDDSAN